MIYCNHYKFLYISLYLDHPLPPSPPCSLGCLGYEQIEYKLLRVYDLVALMDSKLPKMGINITAQ